MGWEAELIQNRRIFAKMRGPDIFSKSFNEEEEEMLEFSPVLGGDASEIYPRFDHSPCERSSIRTNLTDHVGDEVVLSPLEGLFW